jgi:hypothetical protein
LPLLPFLLELALPLGFGALPLTFGVGGTLGFGLVQQPARLGFRGLALPFGLLRRAGLVLHLLFALALAFAL